MSNRSNRTNLKTAEAVKTLRDDPNWRSVLERGLRAEAGDLLDSMCFEALEIVVDVLHMMMDGRQTESSALFIQWLSTIDTRRAPSRSGRKTGRSAKAAVKTLRDDPNWRSMLERGLRAEAGDLLDSMCFEALELVVDVLHMMMDGRETENSSLFIQWLSGIGTSRVPSRCGRRTGRSAKAAGRGDVQIKAA